MSRSAFSRGLAIALVCALAAPGGALADASMSTNWAGYAVHRTGVTFRAVSATWKQPAAHCTLSPTYEATWVGIGGYNRNSSALEQIGTELDCSGFGQPNSGAWYEMVPAPSKRIRMAIKPGDTITATVTVVRRHVTLKLTDRTRHQSFSKAMNVSAVDVRSAEWIVEAPSACFSDNSCRTLPLTNFGTVSFSGATATTSKGRRGPISSRLWNRSKITLAPGGPSYIANGTGGRAVPSRLSSGGAAFMVSYGRATMAAARAVLAARDATSRSSVNPGGHRR